MKTSELINELVDSLKSFGDLPTNIKNLGWYCPIEGGSFEGVNLNPINDSDRLLDEEDEFEDIYSLCDNSEQYNFSSRQTGMTKEDRRLLDSNFKELLIVINQLIKNQKKLIERSKNENN